VLPRRSVARPLVDRDLIDRSTPQSAIVIALRMLAITVRDSGGDRRWPPPGELVVQFAGWK
jgi:hypothetical protein